MTVTFFGHRTAPAYVKEPLKGVLTKLICEQGATTFYVGSQGNFDCIVKKTLSELRKIYAHISYSIVLAYLPIEKDELDFTDYTETLHPCGLETVPPRFTISARNRWMIEQADTIVTYVRHPGGGAARFRELARKKGKRIVELSDFLS